MCLATARFAREIYFSSKKVYRLYARFSAEAIMLRDGAFSELKPTQRMKNVLLDSEIINKRAFIESRMLVFESAC